jgi:hypothetical protein
MKTSAIWRFEELCRHGPLCSGSIHRNLNDKYLNAAEKLMVRMAQFQSKLHTILNPGGLSCVQECATPVGFVYYCIESV